MAVVAACMGVGTAQAQQAWTLRQCVDYAIAHNISVKQMQNTRELQALQLNTDKNSRLPDLNGSAAQNFSFGADSRRRTRMRTRVHRAHRLR